MSNDRNLIHIHDEVLTLVDRMFGEGHSPIEVAAILASISMKIYKTALNEKDYHDMIDALSDKRNDVKPFFGERGTLQ